MPTGIQLARAPRLVKKYKVKKKALMFCPQKRGVCTKVQIAAPKKPNSAQRKVARLILSNRLPITAAIPGHGHNIQQYSVVLIRGGRVRDLPGIRYKIIRGVYDAAPVSRRGKRRSKFGTKNWKKLEKEKKN